jgi:hypothetical protein
VAREISAAGRRGLLKDAPRPGRTPLIAAAMVDTGIKKNTQTTPVNATHWSTRTMAREVGISEAQRAAHLARASRICSRPSR